MFCHLSPKGFIRLAVGFNPALRLRTLFNSYLLTATKREFWHLGR